MSDKNSIKADETELDLDTLEQVAGGVGGPAMLKSPGAEEWTTFHPTHPEPIVSEPVGVQHHNLPQPGHEPSWGGPVQAGDHPHIGAPSGLHPVGEPFGSVGIEKPHGGEPMPSPHIGIPVGLHPVGEHPGSASIEKIHSPIVGATELPDAGLHGPAAGGHGESLPKAGSLGLESGALMEAGHKLTSTIEKVTETEEREMSKHHVPTPPLPHPIDVKPVIAEGEKVIEKVESTIGKFFKGH